MAVSDEPPRRRPEARHGIVLRTGTPADTEAVLALWRAADAVPSITDTARHVANLLATQPDSLIVAESGGEVIGSLIAGWDGWRGTFHRLAVAPAWRRRGIARMLVEEGEARLRARGAERVSALVVEAEAHAVALWAATGFHLDRRIVRFVKTLR